MVARDVMKIPERIQYDSRKSVEDYSTIANISKLCLFAGNDVSFDFIFHTTLSLNITFV